MFRESATVCTWRASERVRERERVKSVVSYSFINFYFAVVVMIYYYSIALLVIIIII